MSEGSAGLRCRQRGGQGRRSPIADDHQGSGSVTNGDGHARAEGEAGGGDAPGVAVRADDYYFESYAGFQIHAQMLGDSTRTETYRRAIMNNSHLFKGKTVLDVGCGTGILSMFAAKSGASRVLAVEGSTIAVKAAEIVKKNKLDKIITVIHGIMEEVELDTDVDIIVSEWMGYCLFQESMLDSVLYARDRYLKPGGLIFPDRVTLYICGIEDEEFKYNRFGFWNRVSSCGFDMSCIGEALYEEVLVESVQAAAVVTTPCLLKEFDLKNGSKEEIAFESNFVIRMTRKDYVHAFVTYFDATFGDCHAEEVLSTAPSAWATHWKQSTFYLRGKMTALKGEEIHGKFSLFTSKENRRNLQFEIRSSLQTEDDERKFEESGSYKLH